VTSIAVDVPQPARLLTTADIVTGHIVSLARRTLTLVRYIITVAAEHQRLRRLLHGHVAAVESQASF
jgi:hypothetical protein